MPSGNVTCSAARRCLAWLICLLPMAAACHEFWLAPQRYAVTPDARIVAQLRVGQNMRGTAQPYLRSSFQRFAVGTGETVAPVSGNEGNVPALSFEPRGPGLHVFAYHSVPRRITFERWEKFLEYLAYEGLDPLAEAHLARGLPRSGITESYTRCAKTLVQVGMARADDHDRLQGMPLELVADGNPYAAGSETLKVRLYRDGTPLPGHQVALFRDDGVVTRTVQRTDAHGAITVPIGQGGTYLLNATDLRPSEAPDTMWDSHWASLTFGLPVALPEHPLDPLTAIEIRRAIQVVGASGRVSQAARAALVAVAEPDKAAVLAWRPGMPVRRRAAVAIRDEGALYEGVIDLEAGSIERWDAVPGVQPPIDSTEWARAQALVKADPRWLEAMRARGFEDVEPVFCESLSAGYFGRPEEQQRRLLKMPCYDVRGVENNYYGRPIEGLVAVVDLNAGEVLRVLDSGPVPVSTANHDLAPLVEAATAPAPEDEGDAAAFALEARTIRWGPWSAHLGFDPRFGPVLSLVTHADAGTPRPVLYQAHLSEIFVPYMDADEGWYHRAYMDAGEYGLGVLSSPLRAGVDCPRGAALLDADLVTPRGRPYRRPRVLCMFERREDAPRLRHYEAATGSYAGRPGRSLVVRSAPSVGNYDYLVDWVFTDRGEIHINVGATGIDAVKGVAVRSMAEADAPEATRSGMLVAPGLLAVRHDHYFSFRLDLDVDGPVNRFVRERLAPVSLSADSPRRSLWRLEPMPVEQELGLSLRAGPELWRFEQPGVRTTLGHHPAFQIQPGSRATSLLGADDWPQRRAAFAAETLWVTRYRPGERFAAGPYPTQSPGGTGLPAYVNDETLGSADLVAWYTVGFHHLTRPEDWPMLATQWHGVKLRPYGFFDRNPGVDDGPP